MLHRLCGPPSIPLSLIVRPYSPGGMLKALAAPLTSKLANGWHSSFTAWTTRVSNPVCSPRFRASASEPDQLAAFATGVLANIYEFHLYTRSSTNLFRSQAMQYRRQFCG